MKRSLQIIKNTLLSLIVPPLCSTPNCHKKRWGTMPICLSCMKKLVLCPQKICNTCGLPECNEGHEFWDYSFEQIRSIFFLNKELTSIIHGLKYHSMQRNGRFLAQCIRLNPELLRFIKSFNYIIPIPLHPLKKRERGYNQSETIAKTISQLTSIPLDLKSLQRKRYTQTQTKLSKSQRTKNLEGAFAVISNNTIKDKCFLLIDDVFTTGSTTEVCAKCLKNEGAKHIGVLTLARVHDDKEINDYELELQMVGSFAV